METCGYPHVPGSILQEVPWGFWKVAAASTTLHTAATSFVLILVLTSSLSEVNSEFRTKLVAAICRVMKAAANLQESSPQADCRTCPGTWGCTRSPQHHDHCGAVRDTFPLKGNAQVFFPMMCHNPHFENHWPKGRNFPKSYSRVGTCSRVLGLQDFQ